MFIRPHRFEPAALWVLACSAVTVAGWVLSFCGQLNSLGYGLFLAMAGIGYGLWRRGQRDRSSHPLPAALTSSCHRFKWRFRHGLPLGFFVLAALIGLSACLHPPNNYDALSYRLPRVLNWLAEGRWHWIHTQDARMNIRVCGSEWLLAPLLALTKTDRWTFLPNLAAFLLLPGLIFSVFTRLGVRRHVAWCWMWLLPSGYAFILQAGGNANDLIGVAHALAAMSFALRARQRASVGDAWLALWAAALLTGCKTSNLPLLLPVAVALLSSVPRLLARPVATAMVMAVGLSLSIAPIALSNLRRCGDWTGYVLESQGMPTDPALANGDPGMSPTPPKQSFIFMAKDPLMGLSGSTLILLCDNLLPPIFPWTRWWNTHAVQSLPAAYQARLRENFEASFLAARELQGEESAGLGFGLSWLLLLGSVQAVFLAGRSRPSAARSPRPWLNRVLPWLPVIALTVLLTKNGVTAIARVIAPYYLLLLPVLLQGQGQELVVRQRWWRAAAAGVFLLAIVVLVLAPERPLWPAQTVLARWQARAPQNVTAARAATVYRVYAERYDIFAPVRAALPTGNRTVGMLCVFDEAGTSLWRPFAGKRVRQVLLTDRRADLDAWGLQYIVLRDLGPQTDAWLRQVDGEIIGRHELVFFASRPPVPWLLVRLRPGLNPSERSR